MEIRPKVLILSFYFPPFGGGMVVRIHNFVKYLPSYGIIPIILTIKENYYHPSYRDEALLKEYSDCVKIYRTKTLEPPKSGQLKGRIYKKREKNIRDQLLSFLVTKVINPLMIPDAGILWLPFAVKKGLEIIRTEKPELIISTGPPFSTFLIAYLLSIISKIPLIIDFRDDWIGSEACTKRGFSGFLEKFMEKTVIHHAAKIISTTQESIDLFNKKYQPENSSKYVLISNGYDPDLLVNNFDKNRFDFNSEKISIIYTGTFGGERDLEYFFNSVKELKNESPDIKRKLRIHFIGEGPIEEYRKIVERLELNEIIMFIDTLPYKDVLRIIKHEAHAFLLFQRDYSGRTAIPGKAYEYLALRKPILCMANGGSTINLLKELGIDLIADYEDIEGIKRQLKRIIFEYDSILPMFDFPIEVLNKFSRIELTKRLSDVLKEIR